MFLKEFGIIFAPWNFKPRFEDKIISHEIKREDVYLEKRMNDKIKNPSFLIYSKHIGERKVNIDYPKLKTYSTLDEMFIQIKKAINSSTKRKYIYSHWGEFDTLSHNESCTSIKTKNHFLELDKKISSFANSIKGTDSVIIITADHGMIDTTKSKSIDLKNHSQLCKTLALPLCGEFRFAYCYVHKNKTKQFEEYVKTKLNHCCEIYKSAEFIKKNMLGLYKPNKKLKERIGDYVLIMKDNYTIKYWQPNEKQFFLKGIHGGLSKEEMLVPLILIKDS